MYRRLHTLALLAIAALLANAQCYALCLTSGAQSPCVKHSAHCHHASPSKNGNNSDCNHQQSVSLSTEAAPDLAKTLAAPLLLPAVFLPLHFVLSGDPAQMHVTSRERGSPPGDPIFHSPTILRI
jgi:hypothetical protein